MTAGILLRDDFDGSALRRLARQSHNAGQTRRLLSPSKDGAGRDLRRRLARGRGADRRRRRADRARLCLVAHSEKHSFPRVIDVKGMVHPIEDFFLGHAPLATVPKHRMSFPIAVFEVVS